MKRSPRRAYGPGPYDVAKPFWLVSFVGSLAIVTAAYLVGVFTYLVMIRVSELPHGALWDDSFRPALAFVLIVASSVVLIIPYFNREWGRGVRTFSILSALFLLAFASLSSTHLADPSVPLRLIGTYAIDPLRRLLRL